MPELSEVEKVKVAGFVSRASSSHQKRMAEDEAELEEMMKVATGEKPAPESVGQADPGGEVKEDNLTPEEKSFKKRYGDLRRHMSEKEREWEKKFEELAEQTKSQSNFQLPSSDEDLDKWKKKYPDIAAIVERLAYKIADERVGEAKTSIADIKKAQAEATKEKAINEIRKVHADFDELQESDEFHDWVDTQPKWISNVLFDQSDDAVAVVRVLDLYKSDKGLTKQAKKQDARDAAVAVKSNARASVPDKADEGTWSESKVSKLSDREYAQKEEEIMTAVRSGKFVYDLSGKK